MEFKKEDESYIYEAISKNIKKYRKLKGWTQEKLAEEIEYSLSFIRGIESSYHQTFSVGALWRISKVLDISLSKLCEIENEPYSQRYIKYKCNACNIETKMPIKVVKHFKNIYELTGSKKLPTFDCTNCNGEMLPVDPMEF